MEILHGWKLIHTFVNFNSFLKKQKETRPNKLLYGNERTINIVISPILHCYKLPIFSININVNITAGHYWTWTEQPWHGSNIYGWNKLGLVGGLEKAARTPEASPTCRESATHCTESTLHTVKAVLKV